MKITGAGIIVEDYNGDLLMHLRDDNTKIIPNQWSFIGGACEEGEEPIDAARREVKEESNLTVSNLKLFTHYISEYDEVELYIFHGQVDSRKEKIILGEGQELKFFPKKELLKLIKNLDYSNQNLKTVVDFIKNNQD